MPVSVEAFHALPDRQASVHIADPGERGARSNLLNGGGKGRLPGLFPPPTGRGGPGDLTGGSAATSSSADQGSPGRSDEQRTRGLWSGFRAEAHVGGHPQVVEVAEGPG